MFIKRTFVLAHSMSHDFILSFFKFILSLKCGYEVGFAEDKLTSGQEEKRDIFTSLYIRPIYQRNIPLSLKKILT